MNYIYRVLVIDDEVQIGLLCKSYKKYLKKHQGIDIEFDIINVEDEYEENKPYDILMVDYDLSKGFSDRLMGNDFIKKFREKNRISKVIFYSSSFEYDTVNKKYNFPFSPKESFDLINILQVDKIAYKNNFEMMIDVIKECCEQIDILPIMLSKLLIKYEQEDIEMSYTNSRDEEVSVEQLISDLLNDNEDGRAFRKKIADTIVSVLLNFKY